MFRKFVALGLVSLFLAMSLAVAEDNIGPYNRAADVNGDSVVDILDLTAVGQAYGSNYTLASEANRTVVTVLSFAKNPPEIEMAVVAIPIAYWHPYPLVSVTNSSGTAVFELSSNTTYTAYAFYDDAYNYANFTTNFRGEASVLVVLGLSSCPVIRNLPPRTLVFAFRDNVTRTYVTHSPLYWVGIEVDEIVKVNPCVCTPRAAAYTRGPINSMLYDDFWEGTGPYPLPDSALIGYAWGSASGVVLGMGTMTLNDDLSGYLCFYGNFSSA